MNRWKILAGCLLVLTTIVLMTTIQINFHSKQETSKIVFLGQNVQEGCLYVVVADSDSKGNLLKRIFIFVDNIRYPVVDDPCNKGGIISSEFDIGKYDDSGRLTLGNFSARGGTLSGPEGFQWTAPPLNPLLDRAP